MNLDKYNHLDLILWNGVYYSELYDKEMSFKCFDEVQKIVFQDVAIDYYKGVACMNLDEYELAIDCFDKFLKEDQNNVDALSNKGYAYYFLGNYNVALYYFDRALENNNDLMMVLQKKYLLFWTRKTWWCDKGPRRTFGIWFWRCNAFRPVM